MKKLRLYFYEGKKKVYVKTFGDGTDATAALDEAREWCKENCEDKGIMDYYLMGNKIWLEYY